MVLFKRGKAEEYLQLLIMQACIIGQKVVTLQNRSILYKAESEPMFTLAPNTEDRMVKVKKKKQAPNLAVGDRTQSVTSGSHSFLIIKMVFNCQLLALYEDVTFSVPSSEM